jgi:hypothetical protein
VHSTHDCCKFSRTGKLVDLHSVLCRSQNCLILADGLVSSGERGSVRQCQMHLQQVIQRKPWKLGCSMRLRHGQRGVAIKQPLDIPHDRVQDFRRGIARMGLRVAAPFEYGTSRQTKFQLSKLTLTCNSLKSLARAWSISTGNAGVVAMLDCL